MHCPMCGHKLVEEDRTNIINEAMSKLKDLRDAWLDTDMTEDYPLEDDFPALADESTHLTCENGECILRGTTFNLHHPFRGPYSRPGDSWSISWIK